MPLFIMFCIVIVITSILTAAIFYKVGKLEKQLDRNNLLYQRIQVLEQIIKNYEGILNRDLVNELKEKELYIKHVNNCLQKRNQVIAKMQDEIIYLRKRVVTGEDMIIESNVISNKNLKSGGKNENRN